MKYIFVIASIFTIIVFNSCEEEITDISFNTREPQLVVEGYVSTDTIRHKVILSKTMNLLDDSAIPYISDAEVTISDGFSVFKLSEDANKKGTYYTDSVMSGVPGRIYSLFVKNVDVNGDGVMEEYSAKSELKDINPIDSFNVVFDNSNPHRKGWNVNLYAMDKGGGRNFYLIKVFKNNVLLTDSVFKYSIADNTGFEGAYYDGYPAYFLSDERSDEKVKANDTLTVEMYGITKDYYNFIVDFITEYFPKVPMFSGPSADISTNIEPKDKAVGIFTAYSIRRKTKIIK